MLMHNVPSKLSMSRSQLREQICQTSKSDRQEWQSLLVLKGFPEICGILNRGVANSFWNHVIQISSIQMYFQDIYSNLWKVKIFTGNIYSLKSNTSFCGTVMFVQDGFFYLVVTGHQLTVHFSPVLWLPPLIQYPLYCKPSIFLYWISLGNHPSLLPNTSVFKG